MSSQPLQPSEVERVKAASNLLRGTIAEGLADPTTGSIAPDDRHLVKFHGSYLQDDRDVRDERRLQLLEPAWQFMLRTRLPGGVCTPAQWLALDEAAREIGNGTLRITTRQSFQLHGIAKRNFKSAIARLRAVLLDSIAACGDVNRNVITNPNPVDSRLHEEVHGWAVRISEHLMPRTRAYYELFLDEKKVEGGPPGEDEPIYGPTYLPRKFKIAVAVPPDNDVDVFAHDLGFIAIAEDGRLAGFDVTAGGGMGATHGEPSTYPRLADVIGFVRAEHVLAVAEAVVTIQRDFGDRSDRKHARLKYTIDRRGLPWFVAEVERRAGVALEPARPFTFERTGDRFGWREGHDGRWHLTLRIPSGRVSGSQLDGLRQVASVHRGDFRLTANQNLIIAGVAPEDRAAIDQVVAARGLDGFRTASPTSLNALACVALPTCGLAMAEAERALPSMLERVQALLSQHGLADEPIGFRITGCPNGCARPYVAEVALVGKGPGRYNMMLGGDAVGQRLNRLYRENVDEQGFLDALSPLLADFAARRSSGERFGDFLHRSGALPAPAPA